MSTLTRTTPLSRRKGSVWSFISRAFEARKQRASLRNLDDAALADLGLTRDEVMAEGSRPIWDVPTNWRR